VVRQRVGVLESDARYRDRVVESELTLGGLLGTGLWALTKSPVAAARPLCPSPASRA